MGWDATSWILHGQFMLDCYFLKRGLAVEEYKLIIKAVLEADRDKECDRSQSFINYFLHAESL